MKRATLKRATVFLAAITLCAVTSVAYALYRVNDEGTWPKSWPQELEPLRKQSRTLVGPMTDHRHYAIPFTNRAAFEPPASVASERTSNG